MAKDWGPWVSINHMKFLWNGIFHRNFRKILLRCWTSWKVIFVPLSLIMYLSSVSCVCFLVLHLNVRACTFFVPFLSIWYDSKIKVILLVPTYSFFYSLVCKILCSKRCPEWFLKFVTWWSHAVAKEGLGAAPALRMAYAACSNNDTSESTTFNFMCFKKKLTYMHLSFLFHFDRLSYTDKYVEQHNHTSLEEKASKCSGNTDANWS